MNQIKSPLKEFDEIISRKVNLDDLIGNHVKFATGNEAIVYGALYSRCRFFAGYPITPATEILEHMAEWLPLLDGYFIQMEDEIASIAAIIGASWNGFRTMTATSGPGFSLMQENIGFAIMTETPCVIVNVSRSGPSTGQPTMPAQGEFFQSRWGTHGDHAMVVLAPSSIQESFDLTIEAFNIADKLRIPVVILTDGELAHMRERLEIPLEKDVPITERVRVTISKKLYQPFRTGFRRASKVPEMDKLGDSYHTHLTGLTHDTMAFPNTRNSEIHEKLVKRLYAKVLESRDEITFFKTYHAEDAEVLLVSFGISARACLETVDFKRSQGERWGALILQTLWPFPRHIIYKYARKVKKMIVVEMNMGQMVHKVAEYSRGLCDVRLVGKIGGELITPEDIIYPDLPKLEMY